MKITRRSFVKKSAYSAAAVTVLGTGVGLAEGISAKKVFPLVKKVVFWRPGALINPNPMPYPSEIAGIDGVVTTVSSFVATSADLKQGYPKKLSFVDPKFQDSVVAKSKHGVSGYEYTVHIEYKYENVVGEEESGNQWSA